MRAISEKRREGGDDTRFSRTLEKDVTVRDPRRSFSDPDDTEPSPLGGADDHVEFAFDTDGDASTFERTLLIDAGKGGILSAQMKDADGAVVGDASVTVDGASLSVDFAKRLLGRGTDRYGCLAVAHDASSPNCTASSPCLDRAPDTGTYLHVV